MIFFFSIYVIHPAALGTEISSASNTDEYQKKKKLFMGSRERPEHKADNLTAISEPTF
jgi:hypothetical protein